MSKIAALLPSHILGFTIARCFTVLWVLPVSLTPIIHVKIPHAVKNMQLGYIHLVRSVFPVQLFDETYLIAIYCLPDLFKLLSLKTDSNKLTTMVLQRAVRSIGCVCVCEITSIDFLEKNHR